MKSRRDDLRCHRRCATAVAMACLFLLTGAGCGIGGRVDKAGGQTRVINLATIDSLDDNGSTSGPAAFVQALGDVSGGRLKVDVSDGYGNGAADAESRLIRGIASGAIDGGWPSSRAFASAGIPGLEAIEAPMTLTSYAAEEALVSGPVAQEVIGRLRGSGVRGLGLSVGPLRRPFAADRPLLSPRDWRGRSVRVYRSPTQAAAVRALGGLPRDLGYAGLVAAVDEGRLDAAESDIPTAAYNSGDPRLPYVTTNVVLWPKVFVLSLSQAFYDSLTVQEKAWVNEAADRAVTASIRGDHDEGSAAAQLCDLGYSFRTATTRKLAALRRAVQPVVDELARNSDDRGLLARIQAIGAAHPGPEPVTLPPDCATATGRNGGLGQVPLETSSLPDGTYRVATSSLEVRRKSMSNSAGVSGTWTLVVKDGTFVLSCRALDAPGTDCGHEEVNVPLEVGDLRGRDHLAYFVASPGRLAEASGCSLPVSQVRPGACYSLPTYKMNWAIDGDRLTFSHFVGTASDGQYLVQPWTRIS